MDNSHEPAPDSNALLREVHALRIEVRDTTEQVRGLVEAWRTAQGVVKFMKMLGTMAAACGAVWALVLLVMRREL